jgi:predicted dehydrogenase/NADPH:quinone reductase-like Zn-dependent oxidoreductase
VKQVAQLPRNGSITVVRAQPPVVRPGWVLVHTAFSLISLGTERTKIETGEKNLLQKARARPDLARKVVEKARAEGVRTALEAVRDRLEGLTPIGYSCAGVVHAVGAGVSGLAPGDRVACGGAGWANHAELVSVPKHLVARVPEGVSLEDAAYATVGSVALHGVRQAEAALGEAVGVIGLGLVGQLAALLLNAAGCRAVGVDLDATAVERASAVCAAAFRREDPILEHAVRHVTGGLGLDAALLCASSPSPDPLSLATRLVRDRGRIVIVGETRVEIDRALLYEKELELRMSRSYGPGRYDREYEEHGRDLPPGYVRWTEQRNMQAFLDLVAAGRVAPATLTTHRFRVDDAETAYRTVVSAGNGQRPFGVLLEYEAAMGRTSPARPARRLPVGRSSGVGVIGAGAFARATLIPALKAAGADLVSVVTAGGLTAADVARRFGFERVASGVEDVLADDAVRSVVVATRHADHARIAAAALRAGKAVFVEKPLALSLPELAAVEQALTPESVLMVGFNRRFAPLVERLVSELGPCGDLVLSLRVNAGVLPPDHWLHDPSIGGGRLLGEGCHFVDLAALLAGSPAVSVQAAAVPQPERPLECSDSFALQIRFPGAVASVTYSGSGDSRLPKERIEAFGGGVAAVLEDFRRLDVYRNGRCRSWKGPQDKGHREQVARFLAAAAGRSPAPSPASYLDSTRLALACADALRAGQTVTLETHG